MPRYRKGTVNNHWDRDQDAILVAPRKVEAPAPPTDEALIRSYVLCHDAYQLHRTEDLQQTVTRLARSLVDRGISSLTSQQIQEARLPAYKPSLAALSSLIQRELEARS